MKTLSILIPTFNRAESLEKLIFNLESQIHKNKANDYIKIHVSDNCSSDNTENLLKSLSDQSRVRYTRHAHNIGAVRNVHFCSMISDDDYIWIMGDDDWPTQDCIENILSYLNNGYSSIILNSSGFLNDPEDEIYHKYLTIDSDIYYENLRSITNLPGGGHLLTWISGFIYKNSLIKSSEWAKYNDFNSGYNHLYLIIENFFNYNSIIVAKPYIKNKYGSWRNDLGTQFGGALGEFKIFEDNLKILSSLLNSSIITLDEINNITKYKHNFEITSFLDMLIEDSLKIALIRNSGIDTVNYNSILAFDYIFQNNFLKNRFINFLQTGLAINFLTQNLHRL